MAPKPKFIKDQRGQILPLALAAFVASMLLFLFLVKAGGLLVQRERARMRTDVTAYSIGVDYARALNVLAVTESAVSAGHVATLIPVVGSFARGSVQFLQKLQGIMLKFGPWLNEISAVHLGLQNGLIAVPLWNTKDLIKDFDKKNLLPSYNLYSRGVIDLITEALSGLLKTKVDEKMVVAAVRDTEKAVKNELGDQGLKKLESLIKKGLPGVDLDWLLTKTGYSKQPKNGGPREYLDLDKGKTQVERKAGGGFIERSHEISTGKKVKVDKGINLDLPLDLEESGKHYITLIAPLVPRLEPLAKPGQPWIWSIAQVQIDGGHFDFIADASFRPRLVPVRMGFGFKLDLAGLKQKNRYVLGGGTSPRQEREKIHKEHERLMTHVGTKAELRELKKKHAAEIETLKKAEEKEYLALQSSGTTYQAYASLDEVHQAMDQLPFNWSKLPGGDLLQKAFEILDIQH